MAWFVPLQACAGAEAPNAASAANDAPARGALRLRGGPPSVEAAATDGPCAIILALRRRLLSMIRLPPMRSTGSIFQPIRPPLGGRWMSAPFRRSCPTGRPVPVRRARRKSRNCANTARADRQGKSNLPVHASHSAHGRVSSSAIFSDRETLRAHCAVARAARQADEARPGERRREKANWSCRASPRPTPTRTNPPEGLNQARPGQALRRVGRRG